MILRTWTGRIRTADEAAYAQYIEATGGAAYQAAPGNLGWQLVFQDLGDGTSEVSTLSWWGSMDDIRAFAGEAPEAAVYYPQDDRFLVDQPRHVQHRRVAAGAGVPRS